LLDFFATIFKIGDYSSCFKIKAMKSTVSLILSFFLCLLSYAQQKHISEFASLGADSQNSDFILPSTHTFQALIENGDPLSKAGETMPDVLDFTGYVPRRGSSKYGYLSINSESAPGAVTILNLEFDDSQGKWEIDSSEGVDFPIHPIPGSNETFATISNCSGTVTPWGTVISCEETTSIETESYCNNPNNANSLRCIYFSERDNNNDGYDDFGWAIEIDPATRTVLDRDVPKNGPDKLWAMGNFKHENAVIRADHKTVYQGADATNGQGYLFKYVAAEKQNLSEGNLFVYSGDKKNNHEWVKLKNSSKWERNNTLFQCDSLKALVPSRATSFGGIEDVEINPKDSLVYFAVKRESNTDLALDRKGVVYRFKDSENGIEDFEMYAGGNSIYEIDLGNNIYENVAWGNGTDNLVFDDLGNLWVAQDESGLQRNYIWVIKNGHTQANPAVSIFARTPLGSEPTGLTFSPDYRYIFMSIQHPNEANSSTTQTDTSGKSVTFDKDITLVIARNEHLGNDLTLDDQDIMISQYYHDEASDSKWIEIKNISGKAIPLGTYFIDLYDSADLANIASAEPKASDSIPAMLKDEVLLFKNSASPGFPLNDYLGGAAQIKSAVCDFDVDGDDVILITTTPGGRKYINRKDIIGNIAAAPWGKNNSLIRGDNSPELPERDFNANNWIELDSLQEVNQADKLKNIALGTHVIGPAVWNGVSWDNNSLPDRTRNTEIDGNFNGGQDDFATYDLTINDGGSLKFENNTTGSNNNLIVHRNLSIDPNGSLIIGDTESLIVKNAAAIVTGNIEKIERSTPRNDPNDITYWSSPVQDEQIENVFKDVDPKRVFYFDQTQHLDNDPTSDSYWEVWVNKSTGPMEVTKGYAAEGIKGSTEIHQVSFKGKPNFGIIESRTLDFHDDANDQNDYNLIGNPYPSAIDIESFLKTNAESNIFIDGVVYLWTHSTPLNNGTYGDDYVTYNFVGATGTDENTDVSFNIGSGQGFFVRSVAANKLIFDPSMILMGSNDQFFKGAKEKRRIEKNRLWINLKGSENSFKQILIGFDEKATDQMDSGYDALYLKGSQPISFYSVLKDKKLTIQGFGPFNDQKMVNLGFDADVEGLEMTIELSRKEGLLRDQDILLLDNDNGMVHDLNSSPYTFKYEGKGSFDDRFSLAFNSTVLGLDDDINVQDVKVYMKDQYLIVDTQDPIEQIKVYDALGRLLLKQQTQSAYNELNLDRIKMGGFFIVELVDATGKTLTKKMVKY
jgi:secreted PhoX family phosphatase